MLPLKIQTGEDWECMRPYRNLQGPTCFSYNIGGTHYISLDDVITTNTGSLTDKESRGNMRGITDTDRAWLKQDLSYIPADTPIVVTTHILYKYLGLQTIMDNKKNNV